MVEVRMSVWKQTQVLTGNRGQEMAEGTLT